eukprot:m.11307 g.11307  ORF g.11307 m.11307 type:complete len:100 (-) comp5694_c0_seq1:4393-4692(-)
MIAQMPCFAAKAMMQDFILLLLSLHETPHPIHTTRNNTSSFVIGAVPLNLMRGLIIFALERFGRTYNTQPHTCLGIIKTKHRISDCCGDGMDLMLFLCC